MGNGQEHAGLNGIDRVTDLIAREVAASGLDLVRVKLFGSEDERTLQVMAEDPATRQLIIEQCMTLSRRISDAIDTAEATGEELISGAFRLEVSSPGIDRPLTRPGDFADWTGHEAKISLVEKLDGRRALQGELAGVENGAVLIEDAKSGRVGVPMDNIHTAKLVLTDRLIAATAPLDTSGAEDFEHEDEADALQEQENR